MAHFDESTAPSNGTQPAKLSQATLKNSSLNFLSSTSKPPGSQLPQPSRRVKTLAAIGAARPDASRSHSPPSQLLSPHNPESPSRGKALSDTAGEDLNVVDRGTPADTISAAPTAVMEVPVESAEPSASTAPARATPEVEAPSSTRESSVPRSGSGVLSSVRKTFNSAVHNLTAQRTGTTTVTTTIEQTVISRKLSKEPESDKTPSPDDKEVENNIDAANATDPNDTLVQVGNQLETEVAEEEIRATSPVKKAAQVASPAADDNEINVATANAAEDADNANAADNADTVKAAAPTQDATPDTGADEDEDEEVDDPKKGIFVLEKIIGHRRDPKDKTLFQMQVSWKNDEPTWEPEQNIQEDAEEALFEYWDSVEGGRLGAMADKNLWHVLRVEKHKKKPSGAIHLLICWVGTPDRSWEPESQVKVYAHQHLEDYWKAQGGREKHIKASVVPAKRGRGRPRKNPLPTAEDKPVGRPGRKPKRDAAEAGLVEEAGVVEEAVAPENKAEKAQNIDEEPPKKRGRGRPRKNPVS
ncbi:Putative chromo/chromo shadow domain, Chromo-like domain superfamily, AT hook, DNA-binding protein [Colletotrichum destructivum]|uniref:Chromo/chromo shadow domain, Chromo-like domain superfamily, AT hook, DNA-binding protein n=1 Tax=Colletotrichum destructivum TaxID=34406 RepID=A0AAX4I066_9PEZI|nr:Putative chromo/chromo shadow domain, Chromo-like domain superfamily, AT hook, DNA-binding protein [Colletotrichum destructivum]